MTADAALSHVVSRDQFIALGYFGSVTRANARLRALVKAGYLWRIDTPFFAQGLYTATSRSSEIVGERVAPLAASRTRSPRFLQHALALTEIRIALLAKGATGWRFEQQLRASFRWAGREWEVRPDGMALDSAGPVAVECDLGFTNAAKWKRRFLAYSAWARSGECLLCWGHESFTLLVVTTGQRRASRLARLLPIDPGFKLACKPYDRLGIRFPGSWS